MLSKKRSASLSTTILITTLLLTTIPIVVFGMLSSRMIEGSLITQAKQFNAPVAKVVADKTISAFNDQLLALADCRARLLGASRPNDVFSAAAGSLVSSGAFRRVEMIDENSRVVAQWPEISGRMGVDLSRNKYYEPFQKGYGYYLSSQYVSVKSGNEVIDLVLPMGNRLLIGTLEAAQLQEVFDTLSSTPNMIIGLVDSNGVWLASTDMKRAVGQDGGRFQTEGTSPAVWRDVSDQTYQVYSEPLTNSDWQVVILSPFETIERTIDFFNMGIAFSVMVLLVVTFGILVLINRRVKGETHQILEFAQSISAGRYAFLAPPRMFSEMETLLESFEEMARKIEKREWEIHDKNKSIMLMNVQLEERVRDRTQQLHATNSSLEKALMDLRDMQDQLIETERMANLGNLVAGVAHEINTPIGVSISSVSFMEQQIKRIKTGFENNDLKRSALESALNKLQEASVIITTNLNNAAELIRSFKRIAVDRSHTEVRHINVLEYIEGVVLSLKPELRKHRVTVDIEPPSIEMNCNPGEFSQIIGNLLTNAVTHGFEGMEQGEITITGRLDGNRLILKVADNGVGISEEHIKSIYEPFYTTKRGSGGTGLGLNIVYNLVNRRFGGSILCESAPGQGACFTLTLPLEGRGDHVLGH